eukprot:m.132388 g.132388  ORF g.132388 m.132388 type:complete len:310 (+) comp14645_c0_seq2:307-1236(+)
MDNLHLLSMIATTNGGQVTDKTENQHKSKSASNKSDKRRVNPPRKRGRPSKQEQKSPKREATAGTTQAAPKKRQRRERTAHVDPIADLLRPKILLESYKDSKMMTRDIYRLGAQQGKSLMRMPGGGTGYSYRCSHYVEMKRKAEKNGTKLNEELACQFVAPAYRFNKHHPYLWSSKACWDHSPFCTSEYVAKQKELIVSEAFTKQIIGKTSLGKPLAKVVQGVPGVKKFSSHRSTLYRARRRVIQDKIKEGPIVRAATTPVTASVTPKEQPADRTASKPKKGAVLHASVDILTKVAEKELLGGQDGVCV